MTWHGYEDERSLAAVTEGRDCNRIRCAVCGRFGARLLAGLKAFAARPSSRLAAGFLALCLSASTASAGNNFPGTVISGNSGSLTASNTTATGQSGEPTTYGGGSLNSMWYSWTAPSAGSLTLQTCGGSTNFDTTLQTFTGGAVNALTQVATNDDACGLQSSNVITATSGTVYRIQVDGYASATGTFTLSWNFTPSAPPPPPAPVGSQACAALTGGWLGGAATSGGIGVTRSLSASGGGSWSGAATDTMNTIAAFSNPAVQGRPSLVDTFNWTNLTSISGNTGTYTISFAKPVTNPVIHIDRVGGIAGGVSNSSKWILASGGTLFRLAGPAHFETFSDNSFIRTLGLSTAGTESSLTSANGTAAGSILISGTHSSVSFTVEGHAAVTGSGGDAFEVVVCAPQADLSLAKVVDNASPSAGSDVTFTLTLTNSGADDAPGVEVTDLLPAGLTFVSATPSQGAYDSGTGIWDLGTVANGASPTLQIVATVNSGGTLTNTAEVTASAYVDPDSDPGDGTGDDRAVVTVTPVVNTDYSDAPTASYGGAGHVVSGSLFLGGGVTADTGDYNDPNAAGDVDDGVGLPVFVQGMPAAIPVTVSGGGLLQAWIDWNGDGSFGGAGEQIAVDVSDGGAGDGDGTVNGTISLAVTVPPGAVTTQTFARFRWSTTAGLGTTGLAGDGEVEDYALTVIAAAPAMTLTKAATLNDDVTANGLPEAGETIDYAFTVTNTGNVTLTGITLTDPLTGIVLSGGPLATLAPGASDSATFSASYTLTQADVDAGSVTNQASASGSDPAGGAVSDLSDDPANATNSDSEGDGEPDDPTVTSLAAQAQLSIVKSFTLVKASGNTHPDAETGDTIEYSYAITNTGNITFSDVEIVDTHNASGPLPDPAHTALTDNGTAGDSPDTNGDATVWGTLAPGDLVTFTTSYTVTQSDFDTLR